ncbi:glutamate racemase [Janthinobacterium sp.]|uniref:glutamate racemase n=1 Tax=Janthinobacterium sp. TaxID=1871054 RepID=UPI00293D3524|nr:glutamate racemase [Janthinobacterium sp.]
MIPHPPHSHPAEAPIGVFDSGVGGLSVLRHIRAQLPREELIYFADTACAPYGGKSEAVLIERTLAIADYLLGRGAKAIVVACNTATVAAIKALRARYPQLPLVGVEPGLKPAAALSRNGKVGVIATEVTLAGDKFLRLREQISAASGAQFLLQGCPGLVELIERGELDTPAVDAMLRRYVGPLLEQGIDTLVLGCTHYPFVLGAIERLLAADAAAPVALVDTGDAVARQLARLLAAAGLLRADDAAPSLRACTSAGAPALAAAFAGLLGLHPEVEEVPLAQPIRKD